MNLMACQGNQLTAHDRPERLVTSQLGQRLRARQVDKVGKGSIRRLSACPADRTTQC